MSTKIEFKVTLTIAEGSHIDVEHIQGAIQYALDFANDAQVLVPTTEGHGRVEAIEVEAGEVQS